MHNLCNYFKFGLVHRFRQKNFQHKIVTFFLPISFSICLGAQKKRLIETVLLSTHNICFGLEIRKLFLCDALLTNYKGLLVVKEVMLFLRFFFYI